jgi:hypothetical protein
MPSKIFGTKDLAGILLSKKSKYTKIILPYFHIFGNTYGMTEIERVVV